MLNTIRLCVGILCISFGVSLQAQVKVHIERPGTLSELISAADKYAITHLVVSGKLDEPNFSNADWRFLKEMAGRDMNDKPTEGKLAILDLSGASFTGTGTYTFEYCSGLTSVILPESVTHIGTGAFSGTGLTSMRLPADVTSIGWIAFSQCGNLTSLNLPDGLSFIGGQAFLGCSGLTSLIIPEGITVIEEGVFNSCSGLTSLIIPEDVTSIGDGAFSGCSSLTSLALPAGITSIEAATFAQCSGLTSLNIPSGVTSIGASAFAYCSNLTSLDLPFGVTFIGNRVFVGCEGLTFLKVAAAVPILIEEETFEGLSLEEVILYVPRGSYEAYRSDPDWGRFTQIIEYDVDPSSLVLLHEDGEDRVSILCQDEGVLLTASESYEGIIYNVAGASVRYLYLKEGEELILSLPSGVYFLGAQRFVVK